MTSISDFLGSTVLDGLRFVLTGLIMKGKLWPEVDLDYISLVVLKTLFGKLFQKTKKISFLKFEFKGSKKGSKKMIALWIVLSIDLNMKNEL